MKFKYNINKNQVYNILTSGSLFLMPSYKIKKYESIKDMVNNKIWSKKSLIK